MSKRSMAFDAKEFKVRSTTGHEFFTPLGVGVKFKCEENDIKEAYIDIIRKYKKSFKSKSKRLIYSSWKLVEELNMKKAIPFADNVVHEISSCVDYIQVSYVILPPNKISKVTVGGVYAPVKEIKTEDFLRNLPRMFSYLTAWTTLQKEGSNTIYIIDSFSSKSTRAWDDLLSIAGENLKIYPRGDECNPLISIADMIAFLTDIKLKDNKLHLKPENIEKIWEDYFKVNVRFLDHKVLNKYAWYNDNTIGKTIDFIDRIAHPIVFLLVDRVEEYFKGVVQPEREGEKKPRKFSKVLEHTDLYIHATNYAFRLGGSIQLFDPSLDTPKVRDGDIMVYMGENSKRIAQTYQDMHDIEVIKGKDLRRKIENDISFSS